MAIQSLVVAEFFGLMAHGAIFGLMMFFGTVGGTIGPIIAGGVFDITGNYYFAFNIFAVLSTISITLAILLRQKIDE